MWATVRAILAAVILSVQTSPSSAAMPEPRPDADPRQVTAAKRFGEVLQSIDWATANAAHVRDAMKDSMRPYGWEFEYIDSAPPKVNPLRWRMYSRILTKGCLNATSIAAGMGMPMRVEQLGPHEIWAESKPEVIEEMIRRNYESPGIARMVFPIAGQPNYELVIFGGRDCFNGFSIFLKSN